MTSGRRRRPSPGPGRRRRVRQARKYVRPDDGFAARKWHRHLERRSAKKARLSAMPTGRRVLRAGLIAGTWLLGVVAALMVVAIVLFYSFSSVPKPNEQAFAQTATIEYADGSKLATIGTVNRTIVSLDQVPKQTRYAVLAAEDRNFYDEKVVSIKGTLRAAIADISGGDTQGGSGITQQYVKNAYLDNEQTVTRKLRELMIAVKLSHEYSKDQILEFYLNTVYFGRNAYGIEAAARTFFGENASQLTVSQSALLAGMLRAPSYYDPDANPGQARDRWRYVLDGMVSTGHLTAAQEAAQNFPKTKPITGTGIGVTGWAYLVKQAVLAELADHGISPAEVSARGLTIRTTLSKRAQKAALTAVSSTLTDPTKKQRNLKQALVAIRPQTGAVLAYYGGTGPDAKGLDGKVDYNDYASLGMRPPGSSFKPYVLATALSQTVHQTVGKAHYAIDSTVDGSYCQTIEGTKICNDPGDEGVSSSQVSLADAMKYSLNTTFDQLAVEVGPDQVAATAHAMGVAAKDSQGDRTLADSSGQTSFGIGIGDYPVTVLDQASGYATLADKGVHNEAYLVQSATTSDGDTVYRHQADPTQAVDPRVANDVAKTLEPIASYSGDALADGRESAAKTGTEGLGPHTTANSDAWMVGFTPQLSAAVWMGSGRNEPIYNNSGSPLYGSQLPGQLWQKFMDTYLDGKPQESLPDQQKIDTDGTTPSPTSSYVPPSEPDTSSAPPPATSSESTPTEAPSTSTPPPQPITQAPPPTTPAETPSDEANCGGLLQPACGPGG